MIFKRNKTPFCRRLPLARAFPSKNAVYVEIPCLKPKPLASSFFSLYYRINRDDCQRFEKSKPTLPAGNDPLLYENNAIFTKKCRYKAINRGFAFLLFNIPPLFDGPEYLSCLCFFIRRNCFGKVVSIFL